MAIFALTQVNGPNWNESRARREQEAWDDHAVFMDGLLEDGFVVLGGPIGDGERVLLVVDAADEREVVGRLAADPWLELGILEVAAIEHWTVCLDGRARWSGERCPNRKATRFFRFSAARRPPWRSYEPGTRSPRTCGERAHQQGNRRRAGDQRIHSEGSCSPSPRKAGGVDAY